MSFFSNIIKFILSLFKRKQTQQEIKQTSLQKNQEVLKTEIKELDKKIEESKKDTTSKSLEDELAYWSKK